MEINLLPQEFKPKGYIVKLAKTLNKLAGISVAILLAGSVVILGATLFLSQRIKLSVKMQEELRGQIKILQTTEQRLVLLKDRLEKIDKVLGFSSSKEEVEVFREVLSLLPEGSSLGEVTLKGDSAEIVVVSANLGVATKYLASVVASPSFKKIMLASFEFKPTSGYFIDLVFVK